MSPQSNRTVTKILSLMLAGQTDQLPSGMDTISSSCAPPLRRGDRDILIRPHLVLLSSLEPPADILVTARVSLSGCLDTEEELLRHFALLWGGARGRILDVQVFSLCPKVKDAHPGQRDGSLGKEAAKPDNLSSTCGAPVMEGETD